MRGSGRNKPWCIYAYEDPENKVVYVGLAVDINNRHSKHKCGSIRGGVRKFDVVAQYFQSIGKPLPRPKIRMENIDTEEDAQYHENWYKEAYERAGWRVLNIAPTGIGKSSVGGCNRKWTEETIREEIERLGCTSRWDFGEKNEAAYKAALDLEIIDKLFPERVIKENGYWMVFENHVKEAEGCKTKKEYDRKNHCAYNMANEYGFINILFPENVRKPITDEELEMAKNYKDRNDLSHNNKRLYNALWKRKLLDVYYPKKVG